MLRGGLFTQEYLLEGIKDSDAWKALDGPRLAAIRAEVERRLALILKHKKPNEPETEKDLIWPVLEALGWTETLPQQNLSVTGREKVPDGLLFADATAKAKAVAEKSWNRFRHGLCIMEAKRWGRPLDRKDNTDPENQGVPSNQILSYLRRVDDVTRGRAALGNSHQRPPLEAVFSRSGLCRRGIPGDRSCGSIPATRVSAGSAG